LRTSAGADTASVGEIACPAGVNRNPASDTPGPGGGKLAPITDTADVVPVESSTAPTRKPFATTVRRVEPITPDHDHARSLPASSAGAAHRDPPRIFSERSSAISRFTAS
jgi:hypothetical protein